MSLNTCLWVTFQFTRNVLGVISCVIVINQVGPYCKSIHTYLMRSMRKKKSPMSNVSREGLHEPVHPRSLNMIFKI